MAIPKKHNLSFTDEELGLDTPTLKDDTVKTKSGAKPKKSMKVKKNLKFEENKPKPSEALMTKEKSNIADVVNMGTSNRFHHRIDEENTDDNASVDAVNRGSQLTENAVYKVKKHERRQNRNATENSTRRTREEKQAEHEEKKANREERRIDRQNINEQFKAQQEKLKAEDPEYKSNPYSKWKQKQDIKKEYYAAKSGNSSVASSAGSKVKESAKKATEEAGDKLAEFASNNKGALVVVGILLALIIGMGVLGSSGGVIAQSGAGAVALTTYPSKDADMKKAEEYYCSLESQLQTTISNYESAHSYNEYHYYLDPIGHDPYELTSLLTAKSEGAYKASDVKTLEQSVYNNQYKLSQSVVKQTRYRSELRFRTVYYTNNDGTTGSRLEGYYVQVPYDYFVCYVTLKNYGIDQAATVLLTEDQREMYAIYNTTKGNREDLFP